MGWKATGLRERSSDDDDNQVNHRIPTSFPDGVGISLVNR